MRCVTFVFRFCFLKELNLGGIKNAPKKKKKKKLAANESMNLPFVTSALATGAKIRVRVSPVCVKTLVPV